MKPEIKLDEVIRKTGNRTDGCIKFGQKPDGSFYQIPLIIVEGSGDGPVMLVDACTHGDEYEGAEAIIQLARELETTKFSGTFIGVPALNFEAFCNLSRSSLTDGANLNRVFPGNMDTYSTHRLAAVYMDRVVKYADYVITFHGGGDVLHLEPIVGYLPPVDTATRKAAELAKAFNARFTWRMQELPFSGVSIVEYNKAFGTVCILPEIGSHCGRLHDREKNVEICYQGIKNVMAAVKMADFKPSAPIEQLDVELHYLHSYNGGISHLIKKEGELVKKGEMLCEMTDVYGNKLEELKAPYDGVVIGFWSIPVIRPGDWWSLYAKIL